MNAMILGICLAAAVTLPVENKSRATPVPLEDTSRTQPFEAVEGAFFAVSVPNLTASVDWYAQKLGLAITFEYRDAVQVTALEGGGLIVELIHDPAAQPPGTTRPDLIHGIYKAGFVVRNFDATVEQLRARGVEIAFGPFPATDTQRANVIIRDNAGNLIQIFGGSGLKSNAHR